MVYTSYTTSFYVYYVYYVYYFPEFGPTHAATATAATAPFSERTVTITLAENCAMVRGHPYHYALIKNSLTEYGLVYPLRLSKKKSTGGIGFFQKSCAQEIENESIPLFWGSNATKKSNGCFRGIKFRQNEIKPLYYIV